MERDTPAKHSLKERALEELKAYWISVLYLWLFIGAFTVYRRLILAQTGVTYLNYGIALIEALIIAKVILVGKMFGFSRWYEDKPLVVPVIYKSILFGVLVFLLGFLEHVVEGLFHKLSLEAILQGVVAVGGYELVARALILIVAFIPFFAFWEMGRIFGMRELATLFFSRRQTASKPCNSG